MGRMELDRAMRKARAHVGKMDVSACREWFAQYHAEGITAFHETVRILTGGYASQTICAVVKGMVRDRAQKLQRDDRRRRGT